MKFTTVTSSSLLLLLLAKFPDSLAISSDTSHANLELAEAFYTSVASSTSGNICVCPLSIHVILGLLHFAASGETANELARRLHVHGDKQSISDGFQKLVDKINGYDGVVLQIASKVYVDKRFTPAKRFRYVAAKKFGSDLERMDLRSRSSVREINQWLERKTSNRIKDILSGDDFNNDAAAVLISAAYLVGRWEHVMSKTQAPRTFNDFGKGSGKIEMLRVTSYFNYLSSDEIGADIIELPYKRSHARLMIVLPKTKSAGSLASVEQKMKQQGLEALFAKFHKTSRDEYVNVMIPRFKIESTVDAKEHLQGLGMKSIFANRKELNGIAPNVYVSKVKLKTVIRVDENGTDAAAPTDFQMEFLSAKPVPIPFKADHPFLFILTVHRRKIVAFMGRFSAP